MTYAFEHDGKKYTRADIEAAIRATGIKAGDELLVHSDLGHFGKLGDVRNRTEYCKVFIDAFVNCLGPEGTLLMPTFSYSFCKKEIYDPLKTPSTVGILTEEFRKMPGVLRSQDAIFSVAALGAQSAHYTDVGFDCFGTGSFFEKLHKRSAWIVFLGKTFDITYMHYVEQKIGVPYRSIKEFPGEIQTPQGLKPAKFLYNVRPLDQNIEYRLENLAAYLTKMSALKTVPLGNSTIRAAKASNIYYLFAEGIKRDPRFLLNL
jgi:aminoglycoside 3-N-acetyltransferase